MHPLTILLSVSLGLYALYALYFLGGLFRLKARKKNVREPVPTVSVVIAARNEASNLPALLSDLEDQDYPSDKLEIIIVDDRSTDRSWSIIQDFSRRLPRLRGIQITEPSSVMAPKKWALTQGIEQSSGEIIVATDGDCRVPATWVTSMVKAFEPDTGIVVGFSAVNRSRDSFFTRYQQLDFLALMAANAGSLGWGKAWSGSGQNLAYRRDLFQAINGFEPAAKYHSGDDVYLVQAISNIAGVVFNASPESFVVTAPMPSLRSYLNQRIRWASNSRRLFKQDHFFLLFLLSAFLTNLSLLVGVFVPVLQPLIPAAFSTKFVVDAAVIFYGANKFMVTVEPMTFIAWSLLQPVYIPLVGIFGLIGKFRWKE
ncbi:MAG: glycosyltransferase [FCB group bacterium]|nr:glycosyltransferase [FCB group bacterium]